MIKKAFIFTIVATACWAAMISTNAQTTAGEPDPEAAAIKQTALDYIEGWYEGNAERMEKALHPELAKRMVETNNGRSRLNQMSAMTLVQFTRQGGGHNTPKDK